MKRAVIVLLLSILATLGFSQELKTFTITPPGNGGFSFVLQKKGELKEPLPIEGESVEVASPDDPNGYTLYLIDSSINRAAKADLVQVLKTKKYAPKSDAFSTVAQINFKIEPKEGVLPAGNLAVTSGDKTESILLTANDNNQTILYFWPEQKGTYKLNYDLDGEKKDISGSFEVPKSTGSHTVVISMEDAFPNPTTDAQNSAKEAAASASESVAPPKGDTGQNPVMAFLRLLVGLAVVGGLAYAGWWYYNNNQQVVEKLADQAGLKAQSQSNADPTGALPPEPIKKDLQKIDLGSSAEPLAGSVAAMSAAPVAKNPRLVTPTGDLFIISEGTATVGREATDMIIGAEAGVSRKHAEISRSGTQITISDSGSTNGTYINGTKITAPTVIQPGDTIQFGAASYRYEE